MRLFIAVNFDSETIQRLAAVQERLRAVSTGGSFSRRENLHLTLAFLGEMEPHRLAAVRRAMDRTAVPPLRLCFDSVGSFGRSGGGVWWAGLRPDPELTRLQRALCGHLRDEGFVLEGRPFVPHVTLARGVKMSGAPDGRDVPGPPFEACAGRIGLMRSQRIQGRLVYTELYEKSTPAGGAAQFPLT